MPETKKITMQPDVVRGALFGSLYTYLQPRLATDQSIDYGKIPFDKLSGQNLKEMRPAIEAAVKDVVKGRLAADADIGDLAELLDALATESDAPDMEPGSTEPNSAIPVGLRKSDDAEPDDTVAKIKEFLEGQGVPPEVLSQLDAFLAEAGKEGGGNGGGDPAAGGDNKPGGKDAAKDETDEQKEARLKNLNNGKDNKAKDGVTEPQKDLVTKGAMDAAIAQAVKQAQDNTIENQRAIRAAERFVQPWVGVVAMDSAKSAEDVYRATLKSLGVKDADKLHADALRPILEAQPRPGQQRGNGMAHDSATVPDAGKSFSDLVPDAKRIQVLG